MSEILQPTFEQRGHLHRLMIICAILWINKNYCLLNKQETYKGGEKFNKNDKTIFRKRTNKKTSSYLATQFPRISSL